MHSLVIAFGLSWVGLTAHAQGGGTLRCTAPKSFLPAMKAIVVVDAGKPGPGQSKHEAIASTSSYDQAIVLPKEGPFDIWWQPKDGLAIRVQENVSIPKGSSQTLKLDATLGVVFFRGEGQPRAEKVVLTAVGAPAPDEKGHHPVQISKDYRLDMVVPQGFYTLWVVPDNGSRPRRVVDQVKVLAGKVVTLD